jgi:hypothetical protein
VNIERAEEVGLEKYHRYVSHLPTTECNMPQDQNPEAWDCQTVKLQLERNRTVVIDALKGFKGIQQ